MSVEKDFQDKKAQRAAFDVATVFLAVSFLLFTPIIGSLISGKRVAFFSLRRSQASDFIRFPFSQSALLNSCRPTSHELLLHGGENLRRSR